MSEYQDKANALIESRCKECHGSGECNDAEPGDIGFNTWTCAECNGTGFAFFKNQLLPFISGDLKTVYDHGLPLGIRDKTGFLLFFIKDTKYAGQEERYSLDVQRTHLLANYLLAALKLAMPETENE